MVRRQSIGVVTKQQSASRPILNEVAVSELIGKGPFQNYVAIFLCAFVAPLFACNDITQFLILLEPEYKCANFSNYSVSNHGNRSVSSSFYSSSSSSSARSALDFNIQVDRQCSVENYTSCPSGYHYNYEFIGNSIVSENDWVCDRDAKKYWAHSFYWVGSLLGVVVIGTLSDRVGRVPAVMLCHLVAGMAGLVTPFTAHSFVMFALVRFAMGFVVLSQGSVAYVLVMEFIDTDKRSKVSNGFLLSYAAMAAILPWISYSLGDWKLVSLITSLPMLVIPFMVYFVPESIKWQLSTNQLEAAKVNIIRVAKVNGHVVNQNMIRRYELPLEQKQEATPITAIVNYKRLMKIFIITNLIWLLQNLSYTGINSYAAMATKNPYMMISIMSCVDVVSSALAKFLAESLGRRKCTAISCGLSGGLYAAIFLAELAPSLEIAMVLAGRLFLVIGYNTQYMYAAEVYPTEVRGTSLAVRQSVGSLGNILAPQAVFLSKMSQKLPLLIFGASCLVSGLLSLLLPESKGQPLPQTLRDGDRFGRKLSMALQMPFIEMAHKPRSNSDNNNFNHKGISINSNEI
ncbi:Solute carrier family 22 member 5 [Halotydeus destructor]|nr:Solute carrier family 22 member 5 [Halotydeus destructor]